MRVINADYQVKVPAGKYWLCDPCYAVPHDCWMDLLNSCEVFERPIGKVEADGEVYPVLGFRTAYGDGLYNDQFNNSFPVDAGLIGLTPVGLCKDEPFGALLVEFTKETTCSRSEGILTFGDHEINTRD